MLDAETPCSPDFTNTEPASQIGPFPQWGDPKKIVAMDPYGHLAPWIFKDTIEKEDGKMLPTVSKVKSADTVQSRHPAHDCNHQSAHEGLSHAISYRTYGKAEASKLPELEDSVRKGRL